MARGRNVAAVAGLATTVVLAAGFLAVTLNRGTGPIAGVSPAGPPAAIAWRSAHVPVQLTLGPLLATSGTRLYVLGTAGVLGSRTARVFSSTDGASWEPQAVSGIEPDFVARAAIGDASGGLLVVGELTPSESLVPEIWYAPDGRTFAKAQVDISNLMPPATAGSSPGGGEIVAVASSSGHLVALGDHSFVSLDKATGEVQALDAWHSTDGESWARVDLPESSGYQARSMTTWSGGFAALASQPKDPEYAVWTSPDGIAWRKAASVPATVAVSILSSSDKLVVLGGKSDVGRGVVPASWSSTDAASWTESTAPVTGFAAMFDVAAVVDGTIVAIGTSHAATAAAQASVSPSRPSLVPPSAWVSTDGSGWRLLGDVPVFYPYLTSMAAFDGRVVVATNGGTDVIVSLGDLR